MDIKIKKIIRSVDLGEYAEDYRGKFLNVWINPPRSFWREYEALVEENGRLTERIKEQEKKDPSSIDDNIKEHTAWIVEKFIPGVQKWYAVMWSQGVDKDTHWTVDEIAALSEGDPAMLEWMQRRSMKELTDFRRAEKKS